MGQMSACPSFQLAPEADFDEDRAVRTARPFPALGSIQKEQVGGWQCVADPMFESRKLCLPLARYPSPATPLGEEASPQTATLQLCWAECFYYEVSLQRCSCTSPPGPDLPDHFSASPPKDSRECIAIGFGTERFPLRGQQPGWTKDSLGYHSDDGQFYMGSGMNEGRRPFGPCFGDGDTVGCGVCIRSRSVFFTLNGEFLGVACTWRRNRPLFPVIGVGSYAIGTLSFGQHTPFLFDVLEWPRLREASAAQAETLQAIPEAGGGGGAVGGAQQGGEATARMLDDVLAMLEQQQLEGDEEAGQLRATLLESREEVLVELAGRILGGHLMGEGESSESSSSDDEGEWESASSEGSEDSDGDGEDCSDL